MDNNSKKTKGPAYTQPDHIKPKSKWTKKTTVWTIILTVIVLGVLAIIGGNNGWFKTQAMINGEITLDDYSTIEIQEADVRVSDSTIDSYLSAIVSHETTYEDVTEGVVEDGDTINLDYSGVLVGEEDPFDGGTAEGTSLTIGSGRMIEGFEEQIIGHEIGETFDIEVTFPEDYSTEDLQGKNAIFTITVNSKNVANVPEMTDELVQHYSSEHMDETFDTVEALEDYYRERVYNNNLESAIMTAMQEKAHIKYYNEANLASLTAYNESSLAYYASMYGVDTDTMASMFGYDSAKAYAESTSKDTLNQTMIIDQVASDQGISYTDEEFDEVISGYMENEGFTGTLDEFKATADEGALYLIGETEVLMPKVMDYLKGNVVIVESPEEETEEEETEAAADSVEEISEEASEAVEDIIEDASEVAEEATDAAAEAVEEVSKAVEDVVEDVSEGIADTVEEVSSAIDDAVSSVTEEESK